MKTEIDAIIDVEKTEKEAKNASEHAKTRAADILGNAKKKADRMVADALSMAKAQKEKELAAAGKRLEGEHEKVLNEARKEAAKIRSIRISKSALDIVTKKSVIKILGE